MNHPELQIAILFKHINYDILDYYLVNFSEYPILVVSPEKISETYSDRVEYKNDSDFVIKNEIEKKFIDVDHVGLRDKQLIPSWYYQQILKYMMVIKSEYQYTHIIDGDSMISANLIKKNVVFTTGKSTQNFYTKLNKLLLDKDLGSGQTLSLITNQMVFEKAILVSLIQTIEDKTNTNWIDAIIALLLKNKELMFSEYQLYGEFATSKFKVSIENVRIFRRMDLIRHTVGQALKKYQIISFEPQHKTSFLRKLRANVFYLLGLSLG